MRPSRNRHVDVHPRPVAPVTPIVALTADAVFAALIVIVVHGADRHAIRDIALQRQQRHSSPGEGLRGQRNGYGGRHVGPMRRAR